MSDAWYYRLLGEEFGPVSRETLEQLIARGTLAHDDEIRQGESDPWVPSSRLPTMKGAAPEPSGGSSGAVATATEEWYAEVLGCEMGPMTFEELYAQVERGAVGADDQVKLGAAGKWRRVGSIGKLTAAIPFEKVEMRLSERTSGSSAVVETPASRPSAPVISTPAPAPTPAPVPTPPVARTPEYPAWVLAQPWYAWVNGAEYGPAEFTELTEWTKTGQLGRQDYVKQGLTGQFVVANTIPGLFGPVASAPPLPRGSAPPVPGGSSSGGSGSAATIAAVTPAVTPASAPPTPASRASAPAVPAVSASAAAPPARPSSPAASSIADDIDDEVEVQPRRPYTPAPSVSAPAASYASSYASSSSASTYTPPAPVSRPSPPKAAPKKKSRDSDEPGMLDDVMEQLKSPKGMAAAGLIVLVALIFGWGYLPASTGKDIALQKKLEGILADVKRLRESKAGSGEWDALAAQAKKDFPPEFVKALEASASRKYPYKQFHLWNVKYRLPEMLAGSRTKISQAEKDFETNLKEASYALRLTDTPPTPPTGAHTPPGDHGAAHAAGGSAKKAGGAAAHGGSHGAPKAAKGAHGG